ncbi:Anhydro-N-acetylmuramic acid kinase [Phaeosphaeriaceae sp. PMI808]|nr:Anhydro-N-acetylmuramic acid kinase [Phaeosphaeriaceae sp. PMI808]
MLRTDSALDTSEIPREKETEGAKSTLKYLDLRVLGVCTESGLNKLDFALVHYRQDSPEAPLYVDLLKYNKTPVPPPIRSPLLHMLVGAQHESSIIPRVNEQLGHIFASGIKTFCQENNIECESIDFVGTYAPTLTRLPSYSYQDMEASPQDWNTIVEDQTGITTVFDFTATMRSAGQPPASLVALVDMLLLQHPNKFRVCLNIDELATISFIPAYTEDRAPPANLSYDCGPGSLFIDYATRYCTANDHCEDHNGRLAADGTINQIIVDCFINSHGSLTTRPPLQMAREMFGSHQAQRLIDECIFSDMSNVDILATVTRVTAENIFKQYRRLFKHLFPSGQAVDEFFICGPSARNANIVDFLEARLPKTIVTRPIDDIGIHGGANEAICYSYLALEVILRQITRTPYVSMTTPSQVDIGIVRGRIAPGTNWEDLVKRVRTFRGDRPLPPWRNVRIAGDIAAAFRELGVD